MLKPSSKSLQMRFEKNVDGNNDKKRPTLWRVFFLFDLMIFYESDPDSSVKTGSFLI